MDLKHIVRDLGGDVWDGGRQACIPAPGHSRKDRSTSLRLNRDGRVLINSMNGTPWRDISDWLQSKNYTDRRGYLIGAGPAVDCARDDRPTQNETDRRNRAQQLWEMAKPIKGTLAEIYVRRRGFIGEIAQDSLRYLAETPVSVFNARSRSRPALLAKLASANGDLCAIEITYLQNNGARCDAAQVGIPRKTVGTPSRDSAIRLGDVGATLIVAEGVFSALGASQALGYPAWAVGSATRLRSWSPPDCVRHLIIAADVGVGRHLTPPCIKGEDAAFLLTKRLEDRQIHCTTILPPQPFEDWGEQAEAAYPFTHKKW